MNSQNQVLDPIYIFVERSILDKSVMSTCYEVRRTAYIVSGSVYINDATIKLGVSYKLGSYNFM